MGVCGNVCCVAAVVKNSVFSLGVLNMLCVCVVDVMDVMFFVCFQWKLVFIVQAACSQVQPTVQHIKAGKTHFFK